MTFTSLEFVERTKIRDKNRIIWLTFPSKGSKLPEKNPSKNIQNGVFKV